MNRVREMIIILIGLITASFASGQSADKPARNALPTALNLKVEMIDGSSRDVHCITSTFRLETDYGTIDLRLDKVLSIAFHANGDALEATVTLKNEGRFVGRALTREFLLEGVKEPLGAASIRELKVIRTADASLLAIIFGLITLAVMEVVLGIDNIIFLAIVAGRLPPEQQPRARRIGLVAALGTRLLLLFSLTFLLGLTKPVITLPIPWLSAEAAELSWRDIVLLIGGAFLIVKSVRELHQKIEEQRGGNPKKNRPATSFLKTILLIAIIDIVFSFDSVITAVGMVETLWVMVAAMVIAMGVMMLFAEPVARFVERYPTVKVLALSFLILIGVLLVAEGLGQHIEKGYVYFAMAFAVVIEFVNMKLRHRPVANE